MKEIISPEEYAEIILSQLKKGILLNTNGDKFNSMVIGWGHLGRVWSRPTFHVYVRQGRYTKPQIDKTGEFTVSVPLKDTDPLIAKVCGSRSGYDVDKAEAAHLILEQPEVIHTPGIVQYPLTLECRVIYSHDQDITKLPENIRKSSYPDDVPGTYPLANRDFHTEYIGEIVSSYIIRPDREEQSK